ncbi:aldo/keto reductase [Enterococcus sp. 669A]|uniref:Aldo/keto reductase n=1 Tax=Candidatus Enterococcus moelleringii TaxID=2815325 RepID=A0ABS3L5Z2_9ENTE|nr:aldo/keto reductase [Enterococcus sp. 669A]MBO1305037.1 aldo/keto reductase [Enterococcus sp. 669A]
METRKLGTTELALSPIGLGTWQFSGGNGLTSKFWNQVDFQTMKEILRISLENGVNWVDTAEAYGNGESERVIGRIIQELESEGMTAPYIADKWWPLARTARSITTTIDQRLALLQKSTIDLYQIHHPTSFSSIEKQVEAMCELVYQHKISYVGVSNFSPKQMEKAHLYLQDAGAQLVSNQVCYNLVNRKIEQNGVLDTAKRLGISIIAYSPLQQGLLTGKFHEHPELMRQLFFLRKYQSGITEKKLQKTQPLIDLLKELGDQYDKTPAQIALNWLIHSHGETVFAIPGATKLHHVEQNIGSTTFKLKPAERDALSSCKI